MLAPLPGARLVERRLPLAGHPVQEACLQVVAEAAEVDPAEIPTALDGCGVVTFALPLERMALAFANLPALDAGERVACAMRAYPDHIRGPLAADSMLMRHAPGWTAKGGAEGLLCAVGPDGIGLALKVEDGTTRAVRPALRLLLGQLGTEVPELAPVPVLTSHGDRVGELVPSRKGSVTQVSRHGCNIRVLMVRAGARGSALCM